MRGTQELLVHVSSRIRLGTGLRTYDVGIIPLWLLVLCSGFLVPPFYHLLLFLKLAFVGHLVGSIRKACDS